MHFKSFKPITKIYNSQTKTKYNQMLEYKIKIISEDTI